MLLLLIDEFCEVIGEQRNRPMVLEWFLVIADSTSINRGAVL